MNRARTVFGSGLVSFLIIASTLAASQTVVNPWVVTDRSVDCRDIGSLVRDVTSGMETPQEQAVALYNFFRRAMFPYSNRNEFPYPINRQQRHFDVMRMLNVYGYALCTQNNSMFAYLCRRSGLFEDARAVSVPGHGTAEVKWDGRWHFMDPIVGAYAYRRDRREIASIEDINADTTLITRAAAEHRAGVPYFPWDKGEIFPDEAMPIHEQWFGYRRYGMDFLLGALPRAKTWEAGIESTYRPEFNLRPGYSLARMWDHLPGMYNQSYEYYRMEHNANIWTPSPYFRPPHHPDQGRESLDSLNYPLLRPYMKVINGRTSCRYFANGRLVYADDFRDERIFRAADSIAGLTVESLPGTAKGRLRCSHGERYGAVELDFSSPYVFVGGSIKGRARVEDGSWLAVYIDIGGESESWMLLGLLEKNSDFEFELPPEFLGERYGFRLRLRLHDNRGNGGVDLRDFRAEGICQLNMQALPFLAPGENRVSLLADSFPEDTAVTVTYEWEENGRPAADSRVVSTPGESWNIRVAGEEYPRMKSVTIECLPR